MELMMPTEEEFKNHKGCCMCFEKVGSYPLKDLRDADNTPPAIKAQAMLLIEMGNNETNKFCEECFWK